MGAAGTLEVIETANRAAMLMDPLRLRLLEELRQPSSASGLARRLRMPRQRINYHLRELEREHLVEFVEERRRGNCVERVVKATAQTYLISPAVLGSLEADPAVMQDRFSSGYLMAVAARVVSDVAGLRGRADAAGKRLATLTLEGEVTFGSAAERSAFAEELSAALARLVVKYHKGNAPGGRTFRFVVGGYPVPRRAREGDP